jgi:hypothetical protein
MEISQGNSLYSYLYLKQKYYVLLFIFFLSSTKLENRRAEQVLPERGGLASVGGGRWQRKGVQG